MGQGIVQTRKYELSMYGVENLKTSSCRIRRGTLRLDGFVSVHAPYQKGYFITPPLVFRGRHLWISYSTSAVGFVRVEIQDEAGQAIHGFEEVDCAELFGDEVDRMVGWGSRGKVKSLEGKTIRLKFVLKDADLYSFGVQP